MGKQKYVIYLAGGGMAGVFGAGVVSYLQEIDFYHRIERVYAASAGGLNAAYFLTHDTKKGSSIYYDNLTKDFLFISRVIPGAFQRLLKGPILPEDPGEYINAIDVGYLFEIVNNEKVLDIERLQKQPIDFKIKLYYNQSDNQVEYLDAKNFACLDALEASCCMVPYTFEYKKIKGKRYVDSTLREVVGFKDLVRENPTSKFIIIINRPIRHIFLNKIAVFFEALVDSWMYGKEYFNYPFEREKLFRKEFQEMQNNDDVILIYPENDVIWPKDTKRKKLLTGYNEGKRMARKAIEKL